MSQTALAVATLGTNRTKARTGNPSTVRRSVDQFAAGALRASAIGWFAVTAIGQLIFAVYIVGFFGRTALQGHLEAWNKALPVGFIRGDTVGNLALVSHLTFAAVIMVAGLLQLVGPIRRARPAFHRWSGRLYLLAVSIASAGGTFLLWTRHTVGDLTQAVAITLNALLIGVFACLAWHRARVRHFDAHRRWALRVFMAASGVWFFRIGLMLWVVVNHGPVGFDPKTFTGPFISFLGFADYLLPLGALQLYLLAKDRGGSGFRFATAAVVLVLTLASAGGIAAATAIMWLPNL